jgi:hypothetical protein
MTDMFGIDGVNRFLSGTLNGIRKWKVGQNLIDTTVTTNIDDSTNLFGIDPSTNTPYLAALREYRLDGVVLSNEEPYSYSPTEGRDATVFNIGIKGAAPLNNGFMVYNTHAPTELYGRGHDPTAYGETMRIGSERAGNTWHGKIGYDFVAAYTSVYTEYPLQMFDRDVRILDPVYLLLRKFNLFDDVIQARVQSLMLNTVTRVGKTVVVDGVERVTYVTTTEYPDETAAKNAVLAQLNVQNADGSRIDLSTKNEAYLRKMVFFQYMPCSSRAFVRYHETLKLVDEKVESDNAGKFAGLLSSDEHRVGKRNNYAPQALLKDLLAERIKAYVDGEIYKKDRVNEHDAVRFLDVLNCAGAWKVGKVIDTRSSRATPYANGPTNASYRMTVVMEMDWLPRNKSINIPGTGTTIEADVRKLAYAARFPAIYATSKGRSFSSKISNERKVIASMVSQTLSERELYEAPITNVPGNVAAPNVAPATLNPTATARELPKLKTDSAANYNAAQAATTAVAGKTGASPEAKAAAQQALASANTANTVAQAATDVATAQIYAATVKNVKEALETLNAMLDATPPADPTGAGKAEEDARTKALRSAIAWVLDPQNDAKKDSSDDDFQEYSDLFVGQPDLFTGARPSTISNPSARHLARMKIMQQTNAITRSRADAARSAAAAPITAAVTTAASAPATATPAAKAPAVVPKPVGKPVTASAATSKSVAHAQKQTTPAPPPGVDSARLVPTAAPTATATAAPARATSSAPSAPATRRTTTSSCGSSLVDETIAASRKAMTSGATTSSTSATTAAASTPAAPPRTQGVVDSVFETIFGASADVAQKPLASPSSPTPSSGSETGPRAYTRRNR